MSERVRNVNSTDTLRTGAAEAGADPDDENRIDFGTLFPAKGDSRRPPEWFGRALLYVALAVIVFMFCWRSWGDISYLVLDIIISLFLALAVEPLVVALVAHGWKRGVASAVSLVGRGRGCAAHAIWQHVRTADDCHGPRFAGHV